MDDARTAQGERRLKIINPRVKFCTFVHLALFFAAIAWLMPSGSIACVFNQLTETFEFLLVIIPLEVPTVYLEMSYPGAGGLYGSLRLSILSCERE
jgi:hypothetical protein